MEPACSILADVGSVKLLVDEPPKLATWLDWVAMVGRVSLTAVDGDFSADQLPTLIEEAEIVIFLVF